MAKNSRNKIYKLGYWGKNGKFNDVSKSFLNGQKEEDYMYLLSILSFRNNGDFLSKILANDPKFEASLIEELKELGEDGIDEDYSYEDFCNDIRRRVKEDLGGALKYLINDLKLEYMLLDILPVLQENNLPFGNPIIVNAAEAFSRIPIPGEIAILMEAAPDKKQIVSGLFNILSNLSKNNNQSDIRFLFNFADTYNHSYHFSKETLSGMLGDLVAIPYQKEQNKIDGMTLVLDRIQKQNMPVDEKIGAKSLIKLSEENMSQAAELLMNKASKLSLDNDQWSKVLSNFAEFTNDQAVSTILSHIQKSDKGVNKKMDDILTKIFGKIDPEAENIIWNQLDSLNIKVGDVVWSHLMRDAIIKDNTKAISSILERATVQGKMESVLPLLLSGINERTSEKVLEIALNAAAENHMPLDPALIKKLESNQSVTTTQISFNLAGKPFTVTTGSNGSAGKFLVNKLGEMKKKISFQSVENYEKVDENDRR